MSADIKFASRKVHNRQNGNTSVKEVVRSERGVSEMVKEGVIKKYYEDDPTYVGSGCALKSLESGSAGEHEQRGTAGVRIAIDR